VTAPSPSVHTWLALCRHRRFATPQAASRSQRLPCEPKLFVQFQKFKRFNTSR